MAQGSEGRTRAGDRHADDFDIDAILPDLTEFEPDLDEFLDLSGPPPEPLVLDRPPSPPPPPPPSPPAPPARTADERPARPDQQHRPKADPAKTAWTPPKVERSIYPDPSFPARRDVTPPAGDELDVPEFVGDEREAGAVTPERLDPGETVPEQGVAEAAFSPLIETAAEHEPPLPVDGDTGEHDVQAEFDEPGDQAFAVAAPPEAPVAPGRLFPGPAPDPTADVFADEATGFIDRVIESRWPPQPDSPPEVETAPVGEVPAVADEPEAEEVEGEGVAPRPAGPEPLEQEAVASSDEPTQSLPAPPAPVLDHFATQLGAEWGAPDPPEAASPEAASPEAAGPDPDPVEALIEPDPVPRGESEQARERSTPETPMAGDFAIRTESEPVAETAAPASAPAELEATAVAAAELEVADVETAEPGSEPVDAESAEPAPAFASIAPTPAAGYLMPHPDERLGDAPCTEPSPVADIADLIPVWRRHLTKVLTVAVAAAAVVALLLTNPRNGGDSSEVTSAPENVAAEGAEVDPDVSLVAEAAIPLVDVYESPDDVAPRMSLEHPTEVGGPLVFLVKEQRGEWLQVFLPVRPNGSTGWVKANQVRLSKHDYEVVVHLSAHRLELTKDGATTFEAPVAIGTRDTPTPGGTFYVKELLKPPDPDTIYGNFAFGLSGFSNVLDSFNGGEGVIGIHGTNDPSVIGEDVSRGCIRMTNEDMLELVGTLPLGTPVTILP